MGGPPDLEPENAHEPYVLEFSDGDDVAATRRGGVKAEETAGGGVGARSGSDVFRDVREDEVVVDHKV